jgi:hypothetical protein
VSSFFLFAFVLGLEKVTEGLGRAGYVLERHVFADDRISLWDYRPKHERITADEIRTVIEGFKTMNWWP